MVLNLFFVAILLGKLLNICDLCVTNVKLAIDPFRLLAIIREEQCSIFLRLI